MKSNTLQPIRRAVGDSVATLKKIVQPETTRPDNARSLRFENLEDRRVLSASPIECDHGGESGYVTTEHDPGYGVLQEDPITYLKVLVNGEERELTPQDNRLDLIAGDKIEVVEIGFESHAKEGVFAAEGYLNKIGDLTSASLIDYNDGRFSDPTRDHVANGEDGLVAGLNNSWTVESGWDRMTINLMHYTEDTSAVEGRFFVNLQVGQPDLEFDTDYLDKILDQKFTVGEEVTIPARWMNNIAGNYHNYAEVDIYHECDENQIIWAGASVGNASPDNQIEGVFLNTRTDDPFTEQWTPTAPGEYVLKYYLDPERVAAESNEANNEYEIRITVNAATESNPLEAVADHFDDVDGPLNVLENDIPSQPGVGLYVENFESETLRWKTNPHGTDTAFTGMWEATDPVGTAWNGVQLQLEDAAEGRQALVTGGLDDGSVGSGDVDGGTTSAISETISVPNDSNAELSFQYTFAHLDNASQKDFFRVSVIGEDATKVVLELRGGKTDRGGEWNQFKTSLDAFAGQDIQLLVEAADNGQNSLIEAAIDDLKVEIPSSPMMIHDFTQGQHGTVTLNEDGSFNYVPDAGFQGQDKFEYSITDGDTVSNTTTVTVDVAGNLLAIEPVASGDEDTEIELSITTSFEAVKIIGVPEGAELNRGTLLRDRTYEVDADDLDGLTILPTQNSDQDFRLIVMPIDQGEPINALSQTIQVIVQPVVDGGEVKIEDFGIQTKKSGKIPLESSFIDLDGSESHRITISGLPEFMSLSAGERDGNDWILQASDLDGLKIAADEVEDTSDWSVYDKHYIFKRYSIDYSVESFEERGGSGVAEDSFELYAWQKEKQK